MVQVSQTEEEIKIIIEMNRLIARKPDIVLLPTYIKFNNPPIYFERHLAGEIDETNSFCRVFKHEARIVLVKKDKGMWPEIFLNYDKEELMRKRLEIADIIVERNKERDKCLLERYETKRRAEIEKEIQRETAMRQRVEQFQRQACQEALAVDAAHKQMQQRESVAEKRAVKANGRVATPAVAALAPSTAAVAAPTSPPPPPRPVAPVRTGGKINFSFSGYNLYTPKRESQAGVQLPFKIEENCKDAKPDAMKDANATPNVNVDNMESCD